MRAYSGAMSNTETAQPTSTRPTTLQEDYVIQDTINQPEGGKDVYAASLAIEMTDQWAYSMDPWTAPPDRGAGRRCPPEPAADHRGRRRDVPLRHAPPGAGGGLQGAPVPRR